jgi:hypothetical protein
VTVISTDTLDGVLTRDSAPFGAVTAH